MAIAFLNVGIGGTLNHARNFLNAKVLAIDNSNVWTKGINKLKWGVKYQHERVDDKISEWELIDSSGYSLPINQDQLKLSYSLKASNTISSNRINGFMQDEVSFSTEKFNYIVTLGVRLSYWDYNNEYLLRPKSIFNHRT